MIEMKTYRINGPFNRSTSERPNSWLAEVLRLNDIVADCYGETYEEAEARAKVCASALESSETPRAISLADDLRREGEVA